mmetsp:Transcript_22808/g.44305  ORF Transcript_22808/g.44305 Transcript_22808/m.44305 type:complete len:630 (+) Transcript_22808:93-1982(+)
MALPSHKVAISAWVAALVGLGWRNGTKSVLSVMFLGIAPAFGIMLAFSNKFSKITGQFSQKALDDARAKVVRLEKGKKTMYREGGESMDWFNFLIEHLWPHIAKYAENIIRGYESTVQKYMPLASSSVHFSSCSLGKKSLQFGPVVPRVVDAVFNDQRITDGGVELDVHISYNSDVDIVLSTPIAKVGIADLSINGTMSIVFRPLISKSPFIGGMEILFNNPPEVEIDFKGIGNIADMPGIYSAVRRAIDDAIAGMMVAPNRMAFAISGDEGVDLARLKNPPPVGLLKLTIIKAENLEGTDFNFFGTKTSDPYVEVKLGAEKWRTPTISKNCNPVWKKDNTHYFFVFSTQQLIYIDTFDEDRFTDDPLGSVARMSVKEFVEAVGDSSTAFPLGPKNTSEKPPPEGARVHLQCHWLKTVPVTGPVNPTHGFVVSLKIDECKHLPGDGLNAPYTVQLSIKGDAANSTKTGKSWPPAILGPAVTAETLQRVSKLDAARTEWSLIAEVLDLDEALVEELLERPPGHSDDAAWIAKIEDRRRQTKGSSNPQFEEVIRLMSKTKDFTMVVELVNSDKKKPAVVGRFELDMRSKSEELGPFTIMSPTTGEPVTAGYAGAEKAQMHGCVKLYSIEDH